MAAAVLFAMTSTPRRAIAEPSAVDAAERAEKCVTRVFISMVGEGATADALSNPNPEASFDALVKDPRFQERFSRFINSQFNGTSSTSPAADASYHLATHVLRNDLPWSEMFLGKYDLVVAAGLVGVTADPNGLGYFHSGSWIVRYADNESNNRIRAAYRMMQNTIGLTFVEPTHAPDVDLRTFDRTAPQCAGCHHDPWFALDKVAPVLGTLVHTLDGTEVRESQVGPQSILGGVMISNDRELAEALVTNEAFNVNACRLAYRYLYGRDENSCEGPVFDSCVEAFKKDARITSALATVAKAPAFCE